MLYYQSNPPEPEKIVSLLNSYGESIEGIGLGGIDISQLFQRLQGKGFSHLQSWP
jgi:hypothetical protein